jgi:hypothetical protein
MSKKFLFWLLTVVMLFVIFIVEYPPNFYTSVIFGILVGIWADILAEKIF